MRTLLLLCGCAAAAANFQVHTAFGKTEDALTVAWATNSSEGDSEVMWGLAAANLTQRAAGDMRPFTVDAGREWQTRMATMTGLDVGQTYYYKVGDSVNGYSDVFSVVNRKQQGGGPFHHILVGDMGSAAAFALCTGCTEKDLTCDATTCAQNTSVGLVSEVDKAGMFLHVGDFAYNLGNDNGTVGDYFMRNIEQVAARVPYMVSHGNHENKVEDIAHYIERFRSQPVNSFPAEYETANGVAPNTLYFSWNYGMVHYVSYSTELWTEPVANYSTTVTKDTFLEWLEADLQKANLPENRKAYPWIVVHGHRPLYGCQDNEGIEITLRNALEPLFFKHGVTFSVNGHQHHYGRSWPTYANKSEHSNVNPQGTIYIVTGVGGSHEMHGPFTKPCPKWMAFRSNTFGYTRMLVHNATHIHLQQVRTDPTLFPMSEYGVVIDDVWVEQNSQGPFDPARAPKGTDGEDCHEVDNFDPILKPMLGAPNSTLPLHRVIAAYRKQHGEAAWAHKRNELLTYINGRGHSVEWEDGALDADELAATEKIRGEA